MKKRNFFKLSALPAAVIFAASLGGCSGCMTPGQPDESVSSYTETSETTLSETTVTSETSETQTKETETTTAETRTTETTTHISEDIKYEPPVVINQRATSFGDMGCGGAAALMAMQSLGLNTDIDTDGEYADFWSSVPKSNDPTRGWNYNSGIWNPAYTNWIGTYTNAQRIQDYITDDIKKYLSQGCTVIPLVSLGDSGYYTHWFTVYGYYETEGVTVFYIADPWGGGLREYTAAKLSEKIEEAARRKGSLGYGYESEAVVVSK